MLKVCLVPRRTVERSALPGAVLQRRLLVNGDEAAGRHVVVDSRVANGDETTEVPRA